MNRTMNHINQNTHAYTHTSYSKNKPVEELAPVVGMPSAIFSIVTILLIFIDSDTKRNRLANAPLSLLECGPHVVKMGTTTGSLGAVAVPFQSCERKQLVHLTGD